MFLSRVQSTPDVLLAEVSRCQLERPYGSLAIWPWHLSFLGVVRLPPLPAAALLCAMHIECCAVASRFPAARWASARQPRRSTQ